MIKSPNLFSQQADEREILTNFFDPIGIKEEVKIDQISNVQHEPQPNDIDEIKSAGLVNQNDHNLQNSGNNHEYMYIQVAERTGTLILEP